MDGSAVDAVSVGNQLIVCQYDDKFTSFGHFLTGRNPLSFSVPILFVQISMIAITSQAIEFCLRPLGQSSIVAHILGGVLYGPSIIGSQDFFSEVIFPPRSVVNLEIAASFGIMFFLFAIGVKQDCRMMVRPGRQAGAIGIVAMTGTMVLTMTFAMLLKKYVRMAESLAYGLPYIAAAQSLTAFPNVACLLAELKMSSSNLGRIAISASMLCDLIGMSLVSVTFAVIQSKSDPVIAMLMITSASAFVLILVFIVRPIIHRIIKRLSPTKTLPDRYLYSCFLGVLVTGLASEAIGQHFMLGPLVFGLMVPDGQPLGEPIITKLDYPIGRLLYPTFLTTSGLKTNIFTVEPRSFGIMLLLIFFSCISKVFSVALLCSFLRIKARDSVAIGLMLNAKGISELVLFNLLRDNGVLTEQEFAICVLSVLVVTAVITPLIRLLYDPLDDLAPNKKRTIQHMKRDAELRILVCIKDQENVRTIINLLEATNATEHSPITVIALLLTELVGRATPMLVAHQSTQMVPQTDSKSGHIINALRQYEMCHENCVNLQTLSSVTHMNTVYDDICRVAMDHNATLVIMPFHKRWEIDGSVKSETRGAQNMNAQVMSKAPCSVAILVDRGILTGSKSILNNQSNYKVGVVYIGGSDDAESLSYGARMGRHLNVNLTIIRFLFLGCDTARERRQDNLLIDEVRQANLENQNFVYKEKVVKDGVDLSAALRSMQNQFDLLLVGKNHQAVQMLMGLSDWSECPELGVVGDLLAAPDFGSTASVLVVQQHKLWDAKLQRRMMKPVVISYESANDPLVGNEHP